MKHDTAHNEDFVFSGFEQPESNYFRMPNTWTDVTARIDNIAELKVVEYTLRHTWGFGEYVTKKHITVDEYMHGRKRKDGSRMDAGTCLSESSVKRGLARAITHGFLEEEVDATDRARIRKSYGLHMRTSKPDDDAADETTLLALASLQIQLRTLFTHLLTIAVEQVLPRPENSDQTIHLPAPPQDIGEVNLTPPDIGESDRTLNEVSLNPRSEKDTSERYLFPDSPDRENWKREGGEEQASLSQGATLSPSQTTQQPQQTKAQAHMAESTPSTVSMRGGGLKTASKVLEDMLAEGLVQPASALPSPDPTQASGSPTRRLAGAKRRRTAYPPTSPATRPLEASQPHIQSARISDMVKEICTEFGDPKVNATSTQVHRIWWQTPYSEDGFYDWLIAIRSEVRQRKREGGLLNPMGYFMSILKKLVPAAEQPAS